MDGKDAVAERYQALRGVMDERVARCWAGAKALALGRGSVTAVARPTGLSRVTVRTGCDEVSGKKLSGELVRVRRKGAVRPKVDHDTPVFAANSIEAWWRKMDRPRYPKATHLLVTANSGGSNSARSLV